MISDRPLPKRKRRILRAQLARGLDWKPPRLAPLDPERAAVLARIGYSRKPLEMALARIKRLCMATTRKGTPCLRLALANGRCRNHGGLSTGPKTPEGWERTRAGYAAWRERQRGPEG